MARKRYPGELPPNWQAETPERSSSLGKVIGIGCLGVIGIFVGLAALGAALGDPAGTASDEAAQASLSGNLAAQVDSQTSSPASSAEPSPAGKWLYSENRDELRNQKIYEALLVSENSVEFGFPYSGAQNMRLQLRKHPEWGQDVIFAIERGQFICGVYECNGTISIDGDIEKLSLVPPESHDSTVVFAKFGSAIAKKLKSSKKVVVEMTFYQEGSRQFVFETSGLEWPH